jgi:trehalose 6-phosphate synthase/phosphatase
LIPHAESKETSPSAKITDQTIVPVYINQNDRDSAYIGCCKSSLWPLLHSMADRAIFSEDHWEAYMRLNHAYAEETLKVLRTMQKESNDDAVPIVWIHDYHLMVVANIVRRVAKEDNIPCKIAFFMHSPFPPYDMIKILPHKDVLLQGILGADLVR